VSDPSIDTSVPRRIVVASHGMGDTAATWDAVVPGLADLAEVRRWSLRGHGDRPWDGQGDYLVVDASADLATEVDAAIATSGMPVVLLGHSLGGYLSLIHALRRPDQVAGLVLVATGPGFRSAERREQWNEYALSVGERAGFPRPVAAVAMQHDSFVMEHLTDLADLPITHLVGERDTRFHAGAAHISATLPHSSLIEVPGAGHHPQRTHPDAVTMAVVDLLRSLA
jgi:pimeloyl-ACP methyl ester carboxylesterase